MAAYTSGTVRLTSGLSKVYGTLTDWLTFVQVGDLFKVTAENVFYQIAAVNTATELTLTSRYSNTVIQSAVATNVASVTIATKMYSGNLGSFTPVIQSTFVLEASPNGGGERFTDNGAGVLTGEGSPAGSGTVDYDSGAWAITLGTDLTATLNLAASFTRGNSSAGVDYQIVVDFTPNYRIPEMSTNDVNFSHIYTRAMRTIDTRLFAASRNLVASTMTASHFHGLVSASMVTASIDTLNVQQANITNATILNATITNAKIINATLTNATIQKLKGTDLDFVNASITEATIANLNVNGIFRRKITPKKADYVATPSDNTIVVGVNTASVHITLPYASAGNLGVEMVLINNSTYALVASCRTGQTIDGSAKVKLLSQYNAMTVVVATTNLWVQK